MHQLGIAIDDDIWIVGHDDEKGCFRRLCRFTTSVIPAGNAGTQTPGMAKKLPVNPREITIAKTLPPTTNIRAVMPIVEEESHNPTPQPNWQGFTSSR
uniref:Uncharacterized protein n=1 Tax=Candidatus Kentrum sp. LFY TaxID=2126342 RepID=A0A450WBN9_9GAMM|nr:MAG: hypothetical protein BECKLFY1418C_GA0070996_100844 [Candidatus Kentron sp. LFY]